LLRMVVAEQSCSFSFQDRKNSHCPSDEETTDGLCHAILCYLAVRKLGLTSASIAKELGISPSAVSKAILRAPKLVEHAETEALMRESQ
jgi:hypothetical protein